MRGSPRCCKAFTYFAKAFLRYSVFLLLTGKDPLAGLNHWKDINAVAGVFRAYFRELQEPLFPSKFCDDYIRISRMFSASSFRTSSLLSS